MGSEAVLALVSDKWTIQIIHAVFDGAHRYGELRRAIPTITRKMLAQRLRELERNGILSRHDYEEMPPRVEYALTPTGESLSAEIAALCHWSKHYLPIVEAARREYDARAATPAAVM
ncbi:MAG: helix-turn-helix domain-containing protein [Chloroflexota bacterium]|nr:helix-turn-helix domain-containing protein [Chloroflexota bacterium]